MARPAAFTVTTRWTFSSRIKRAASRSGVVSWTVSAGDVIRSPTRSPLNRFRMALVTSPEPRSRSVWLITPSSVPPSSTTGSPVTR